MNDEDLVAHLLTFLTPKYHNIRRFIWDRPIENQTIDYIRNTLLEHEAQTSLDAPIVEKTALKVSTKKDPHYQVSKKHQDSKRPDTNRRDTCDLTCFYCLKKDHIEPDCRLK